MVVVLHEPDRAQEAIGEISEKSEQETPMKGAAA
jgi:hypothetical protein